MRSYSWELVPNFERNDNHISMILTVHPNFIINLPDAGRIYDNHSFPVQGVFIFVIHFSGAEWMYDNNS